ncbi:MAG: cell division ATP-binding protein FtsE [Acutalibacteraceae bacterium]|nr:cell division ATP-binding protein FtsE [Acutalibacteraceae bacterium]
MIEFINVSKTYTDSDTHALNDISFNIDDGEFVFIVGPSGAGKSTLLKLIMREQKPTKGDIIIDGEAINKLRRGKVPYLRRKMGMVYQDFRLIDKMNVFDNVAFAMRVIGAGSAEIKERVTQILKLVGLEHKMMVRPSQLSGGEQQRVSLARALANTPKILIADEPTANVDAEMSFEIMRILKKINSLGTTVLVVTHDKGLVEQFGGRIMELEKGKVVAERTIEEALHNTAEQTNEAATADSSDENKDEEPQKIAGLAEADVEVLFAPDNTSNEQKPEEQEESEAPEEKAEAEAEAETEPEIDINKYDDLIQEIKIEQLESQAEKNNGDDL